MLNGVSEKNIFQALIDRMHLKECSLDVQVGLENAS